MNMFIKKVFEGINDEEVHSDLLKFGKGTFDKKYLIEAKKTKDQIVVKTGPEFANFLVKKGLEGIDGKIKISGVVISTFNLKDHFSDFVFSPKEELKKFMGIVQLKINEEVEARRILEVMEKFPRVFFALSFSIKDFELKIKPKAPKSPKPSAKGEKEPTVDFCSLKTKDFEKIKDLFFDVNSFNNLSIEHTIIVENIEYPSNFSKMKPEEVREKSKRKGKIIRKVVVDGVEKITEKEFFA